METRCKPTEAKDVLEPFLLERRLVAKVWGGRALADELGIALPADGTAIGESWELFDRPDGSSAVRGSERTLGELVREHASELVGEGVALGYGNSFPLLLKFLDCREGLSLQVHPDERHAVGDGGKDECCLILRADADASIVHGVRRGVDRDAFLALGQSDAVEQVLYRFRPQEGDLVHIPPGTPHALGPGVLCFEVQQNSDLTYRFYDWGRGRETHVEAAGAALRMVENDRAPVCRSTSLPDGGELLLANEHFVVRRYQVSHSVELEGEGRFLTVTVLAGDCRMRWSRADGVGEESLTQADTALVPACTPRIEIEPMGGALDVVVCGPGIR